MPGKTFVCDGIQSIAWAVLLRGVGWLRREVATRHSAFFLNNIMNTTKSNTKASLYNSVHYWLKTRFGKADHCESSSCTRTSMRFEWALKNGRVYEKNRKNFLMLCASCHQKMDWQGHSEEVREKIRESNKRRVATKEGLEKVSGKNNHFYGKKHTEETRRKMREARQRRAS